MINCEGWPDQPCAWDRCVTANACQNPHGPSDKDYAIDPTGAIAVEVQGASVQSVEVIG